MHRRPRLTVVGTSTAVVAVVLGLTGCSRAVKATVPQGAGSAACAAVVKAAPATLLKQGRRDTTPASPGVTAWGDPAIVLRCGVTAPGPTTDQCTSVDGIDWVAQPVEGGYAFTTYGRSPAVQVLVPGHYAPETFALTGLSAAVAAIPQGEHRCS